MQDYKSFASSSIVDLEIFFPQKSTKSSLEPVNISIDGNKVLMEEPFRSVGNITSVFKDDMLTAKKIMDVVGEIRDSSEKIA